MMASKPNSGGKKSKLMKAHMMPTTTIGVMSVRVWIGDTSLKEVVQ